MDQIKSERRRSGRQSREPERIGFETTKEGPKRRRVLVKKEETVIKIEWTVEMSKRLLMLRFAEYRLAFAEDKVGQSLIWEELLDRFNEEVMADSPYELEAKDLRAQIQKLNGMYRRAAKNDNEDGQVEESLWKILQESFDERVSSPTEVIDLTGDSSDEKAFAADDEEEILSSEAEATQAQGIYDADQDTPSHASHFHPSFSNRDDTTTIVNEDDSISRSTNDRTLINPFHFRDEQVMNLHDLFKRGSPAEPSQFNDGSSSGIEILTDEELPPQRLYDLEETQPPKELLSSVKSASLSASQTRDSLQDILSKLK